MKDYIKIKESSLLRNMDNMSIINTDTNELQAYLNKRKILLEQKSEINNMKQDILELKNSISEIKELLIQSLKGN